MTFYVPGLIILFVVNLLIDWYILIAIKHRSGRFWVKWVHYGICFVQIVLFGLLIAIPIKVKSDVAFMRQMMIAIIYLSLIIAQTQFVISDLIAHVPCLFGHKRWKVLSIFGWMSAIILFLCIWWGVLVNRYRISVEEVDVAIENLPSSFDGFTIAQISDMHTGTYLNDTTFVSKVVDKINSLDADMVVFTGDIVNRHSAELKPFVRPLSRLSGRYGQYAVLGNHDYGNYYFSEDDSLGKKNDMQHLRDLYRLTSFDLLTDESRIVKIGQDSIVVIGVENISRPGYHNYGSLEKAYHDTGDDAVKILLSHDPYHWLNDIAYSDDVNVALTLSGHTHAMQIKVLGLSPSIFVHPAWSGLYSDDDGHQLYVNIGIGTVGTPMRVGATPEITLITLHRK